MFKVFTVFITCLLSFLSLFGVIIFSKSFGFQTSNFHNPEKVFDSLTLASVLAIMLVPMLIALTSHLFLLKGKMMDLGLNKNFSDFFLGVFGELFSKLLPHY